MPDKGEVMSQTYYEKQSKLLKVIQESFKREEMTVIETISSLRKMGFSESVAISRVNEWKIQRGNLEPETEKDKKRRLKEKASLENYVNRMRLGKRRIK